MTCGPYEGTCQIYDQAVFHQNHLIPLIDFDYYGDDGDDAIQRVDNGVDDTETIDGDVDVTKGYIVMSAKMLMEILILPKI